MKLISSAIRAYRYFSTKLNQTKLKNSGQKKIKWTDEQKQVLAAVSDGKSVFISGSAGTGKTVLLEQIIKQLKKIHGRSRVFVTGSTGVAACAIKGQTLHSFAGIGLGQGDCHSLVTNVLSKRDACGRWNKVLALVIDEISMIDGALFDKIEFVARYFGDESKTWGGIQLVVTGDFFQLPPVCDSYSEEQYAFEAECWGRSFDVQFELTTVFRQSDVQLVKLLQGIRRGEIDRCNLQLLQKCFTKTEPDSSVARFYPRNDDVYKVNKNRLESLGEQLFVFRALDEGAAKWKSQLKNVIAPDELEICTGARVMLIKNLNSQKKLFNGATGTVVGFEHNVPSSKDNCKCEILPIVKFDSMPDPLVIIEPAEWVVMNGEKIVARRKQIPLILAYAVSIHKCQGMTLDSIHTDLSRAFGYGMVYVALSRVRSLNGLHITGFDPSKIRAHPKVLKFYEMFGRGSKRLETDVNNNI